MAATTPESGTGTTTSASAGHSRASKWPKLLARFGQRTAEDDGIGSREIDVFEGALGQRLDGRITLMRDAFGAHDHHFAGLDIVQVNGVDQIEGARFRREHVALAAAGNFHFAHGERAETMRAARDDDAVLREKDQRKGAFELQQRVAERAGEGSFGRVRHQVEDDFGVAGGLEDGAAAFEIGTQLIGVGDVAVMSDGDFALVALDGERLGVE